MQSTFDDEDAISSDSEQSSVNMPKSFFYNTIRSTWTSLDFLTYSIIYLISINNYFGVYYVLPGNPSYLQHIICMLLIGMPIQYMQVALGQYTQMSAVYLKYMSPISHGIGYSMIISTLFRILPNGVNSGDSLLYFLNCMQSQLPWHVCDEKYKSICWGERFCNDSKPCISTTKFLPSYLYWNLTFMQKIPMEFEIGPPDVRRFVTIVCMWFAIFCILINTISLMNKIIKYLFYISFGTIIVILMMLLLVNLDGKQGFGYILHVSMDQLTDYKKWSKAVMHVCTTLNLGRGGFMLLGSHLSPESYSGLLSVLNMVIYICVDFVFSLLLNVSFAILAHASKLGNEVDKVMGSTSEYVEMTVIPNALLYTNAPQLWSFLYFACNVIFSYATVLINLRIMEVTLADVHPNFVRYRKYIQFALLVFCLLTTLFYSIKGTFIYSGYRYTVSLDTFELFLVCAFITTVSWIYGVQRVSDDIHFILGVQPTKYWKICWYFSPLIWIFSIQELISVWTTTPFSIFMFVVLVIPLVILMISETFRYMKKRNLVGLFQPEELWGPPEKDVRHMRLIFNPRREIRSKRRNDACQHKCLIGSKVLKRIVAEEAKFQMYRYTEVD